MRSKALNRETATLNPVVREIAQPALNLVGNRIVLELTVPYPPSINHYWRHTTRMVRGTVMQKVYISEEGQKFRQEIKDLIRIHRIPAVGGGSLFVEVFLNPPDKRKRDIDNPIKSLLDALQHAGVYSDDSKIDRLYIDRLPPIKGGNALIRIRAL